MAQPRFLPREQLQTLIDRLRAEHGRCVGPVAEGGAIVYREITQATELPVGWHDRQGPGSYRLLQGEGPRCFAWANGPRALKPLLLPPEAPMWQVARDADGRLHFATAKTRAEPLAVLGVRACDLAALDLFDRHFLREPADTDYRARREALFLVAMHCSHPAATCFCADTGDGPECQSGFDLALHELDDGFVVQAGSAAGQHLMQTLALPSASTEQCQAAHREREVARAAQHRQLPPDLTGRLLALAEDARWQDLEGRCLACGNCTAVCPTCFCHRHEERPALAADTSAHWRLWDSCFADGHSLLHGRPLRTQVAMRYRQWLTHKLDTWVAQYGRSGCVGCGRCISWCPVGIDLVSEATTLMEPPHA